MKAWEYDFRKTHFKYETTPPYSGDEQEGGSGNPSSSGSSGVPKYEIGAIWKPRYEVQPNFKTRLRIISWDNFDDGTIIINADKDSLIEVSLIKDVVKRLNQQKSIDVKQEVIKSTDHFFNNHEEKVIEKVKKYCLK
mgnify:CR=1 FL=1